jgi:sortase A
LGNRESGGGTARRLARIAGAVLALAGALALIWAVVVWRWQDPFTAVLTQRAQSDLASTYEQRLARLPKPEPAGATPAARLRSLEREARAYRRELDPGDPVGRIVIPRLGLKMMVVEGTAPGPLKKGPGRDERTYMPGEDELVYIAGHRTTYLAPFAHIERLVAGDRITLSVPYATFEYRVTGHTIVKATAMEVLRSPGHEILALQACHPRFFATHRYLVYAEPVRITPRDAPSFSVSR